MDIRAILRDEHGRTKIGSVPDMAAAAAVTLAWVKANLGRLFDEGDPVPDEVVDDAEAVYDAKPPTQSITFEPATQADDGAGMG